MAKWDKDGLEVSLIKLRGGQLNVNDAGNLSFNNVELGASQTIPGEIKWFSGSSVPSGYLICNGSAVNRTTYSALFEAIGTTWGAGDGSTTFALPNLINRVAWGGSTSGTYKNAGLPNIKGTLTPKNSDSDTYFHTNSSSTGAFYFISYSSNTRNFQNTSGTYPSQTLGFQASKSNSIYGASSTVQPPAATLLPIIKY